MKSPLIVARWAVAPAGVMPIFETNPLLR